MAERENNEGEEPVQRSKNRVLVAMNYVLVLAILVGIGVVLFKSPSTPAQPITGSAAVDAWCETHTAKEDCTGTCGNEAFDAYAQCVTDCLKKMDECKTNNQ